MRSRAILLLFIPLLSAFALYGQNDAVQLLAQIKKTVPDSVKIDDYTRVYNYYQFAHPDSALYYVTAGLNYFTGRHNNTGIAAMTALMAMQDAVQGRSALAREKYNKALQLYNEAGDVRGMATVTCAIGVLEGRNGNLEQATGRFLTALKEYEQINDVRGMVNTYMKLGVVNEKSEALDKALECYNKALSMLEIHPLKGTQLIYLYNNVGIIYAKKGDLQKAKGYFEQALKGSDSPAFLEVKILSLTNLGIVYDHFGDDKKALAYYDQARQLTNAKEQPENFARLSVTRSSVERKTDPAKAVATLQGALQIVKSIHQQQLQAEIYGNMAEIYEQQKDYKQALATVRLQKSLEDSLLNIDKAKEIANLQSVYELERSNARVNTLETNSRRNIMQRNVIVAVAAGLVVSLALLTFFFTRSRRLNNALRARETELERSNEVKDKLFSIIGHDLRGPVGNIPVMLEMLHDGNTTAGERNYLLATLTDHSKASIETLDKLLYWGQTQIKGIGMKQITFATDEYVDNSIKLIKSSAEQKEISITNKVAPGTMVYADAAHFDFVMRNLVSNAVKFTHSKGSVVVSADERQLPGYIVFAVKDNGIGIAKDKLADVFRPSGNSTRGTANEKGTSIGLMLCKEFVTENGGKIWVESEEGAGSVFYFSLKAAS